MRRSNRITAFALVITLALVMLLSSAFAASGCHHACTGLDCAVCEHLAENANLLLALAYMLLAVAVAVLKIPFITSLLSAHVSKWGVLSPVSLKVKLSD